jgi:hypothetical protein
MDRVCRLQSDCTVCFTRAGNLFLSRSFYFILFFFQTGNRGVGDGIRLAQRGGRQGPAGTLVPGWAFLAGRPQHAFGCQGEQEKTTVS